MRVWDICGRFGWKVSKSCFPTIRFCAMRASIMGSGNCSVMFIVEVIQVASIFRVSSTSFHSSTMLVLMRILTGLSVSAAFRRFWVRGDVGNRHFYIRGVLVLRQDKSLYICIIDNNNKESSKEGWCKKQKKGCESICPMLRHIFGGLFDFDKGR